MDRESLSRTRRGARAHLPLAALGAAAALAAAPAAADAELAAGLVGRDTLVLFDTARPGFVAPRAITGLLPTDTVIGIDVRPETRQLYALAVPAGSAAGAIVRTYVVDPQTGAATFVGMFTGPGDTGDHRTGLDFNPRVDRIRVDQATGVNLRSRPDGALAANDTRLAYIAPAVGPLIGVAYDRSVPSGLPMGTLPTTAYGIDAGASRLARIGDIDSVPQSANNGQVSDVGPLGVTLDPRSDAGFDISPAGTAYAALRTDARASGLYTLNLATGAATLAGALPADLRSLAILPPGSVTLPPEPPPTIVREPVPATTVTVPGPPGPTVIKDPPPPPPRRPAVLIEATAPRYAALLRGRATVRFSCDAACSAAVLLVARRTTIAAGTARLTQAGVGTVRLVATAGGRNLLAPRARRGRRAARAPRSVAARLTLTATSAPGLRSTASVRLLLRR